MIFHENRLLADDSHEISYLIVFFKLGKMSQNLSSAAVVIGALRVNILTLVNCLLFFLKKDSSSHSIPRAMYGLTRISPQYPLLACFSPS